MSIQGDVTFELRVGPHAEADLAVTKVTGVEEMSRPYVFRVDFVSVLGHAVDLGTLVQAEACLGMKRALGQERWVHGICVRAEETGLDQGKPSYRVTMKPKLALLEEKEDCRIFLNKSGPEMVRELLDAHGIVYEDDLAGSYPKRETCVQYRENDLSFVSRLLEDEGIAYWFEQNEDGHVMVLGDGPKAFPPLPGGELLPYRTEIGRGADEEYLHALRVSTRVAAEKATLSDYDFERPTQDVTGETSVEATHASPEGAEVCEHSAGRTEPSEVKRLSRIRLEELQFESETWQGQGTCARMAPGHLFEVTEHPFEGAVPGGFLTVYVEHEGKQQPSVGGVVGVGFKAALTYKNSFVAIDEKRAYRPKRRTKPPLIAGHQTATVVGVASEEIHPDMYGRVKVRFHWDREEKKDDQSSGWVRTAQSWAGPGSGALFVPRVGQEVVVRFLEGNPDRPIVTGAVYSGVNEPPITLPHDKTKSTLKSDSSPYTGGSNELRFEDAKDMEEVALHAQRDHEIEVGNDKEQSVHGNEELHVTLDRHRRVKWNQDLVAEKDDRAEVNGNQALTVKENRSTLVGGGQDETVQGDDQVSVRGMQMEEVKEWALEQIGGAAALTVGEAYDVKVTASYNQEVGGNKRVIVRGSRVETFGNEDDEKDEDDEEKVMRREEVGGNSQATVKKGFKTDVTNQLVQSAGKELREKTKRTEITVDELTQLMTKKCELEADKFTLVMGKKVILSMEKSGKVDFYGKSITVDGQSVSLRAPQIKTLSPESAAERAETKKLEELKGARAVAEFTLLDQEDHPVGNQRYRIEFGDGTMRKGITNADGYAKEPAPGKGSYKVIFLDDPKGKTS